MVAVTQHRKVSLGSNIPSASGLGLGIACGCVSQKQQTQCKHTSHGCIAALEKSCDSQVFLGCKQGGHAVALSIFQDADGRLTLTRAVAATGKRNRFVPLVTCTLSHMLAHVSMLSFLSRMPEGNLSSYLPPNKMREAVSASHCRMTVTHLIDLHRMHACVGGPHYSYDLS